MPKIIERFSPLFNISTFFYMLKWNYLHVKRTNMYFHGLCYTRCYVKPAKAIWVPKHFCPKKRCLSVCVSLSLSLCMSNLVKLLSLSNLVKLKIEIRN